MILLRIVTHGPIPSMRLNTTPARCSDDQMTKFQIHMAGLLNEGTNNQDSYQAGDAVRNVTNNEL